MNFFFSKYLVLVHNELEMALEQDTRRSAASLSSLVLFVFIVFLVLYLVFLVLRALFLKQVYTESEVVQANRDFDLLYGVLHHTQDESDVFCC